MWENIERGYYITLENGSQDTCDVEKIMDEIISHYMEESKDEGSERSGKSIIIDTYLLESNWNEYMRFRRKAAFYREQGFTIRFTF